MLQTTERPTKSNRKPKLLETDVTPTKQTKPPRSNRKENAVFAFDFNSPGKPPSPSSPVANLRHRKQKANSRPLIFVAIKTQRERLFSYTYTPFLISPCSDYFSLQKSSAGVPAGSDEQTRPPRPHSTTDPKIIGAPKFELSPPKPYPITSHEN